MPNRWTDDRDRWWRNRQMRERQEREAYRGEDGRGGGYGHPGDRSGEDRSFSPDEERGVAQAPSGERLPTYDMYRWRRPPELSDDPYAHGRRARAYGAPRREYERRPAPPDHWYFGFGHDVRGSEYEQPYEPGERYTPNVREGRGESARSWWDRTRDEVSSWFGDHDAERRRLWDTQASHRGRGPKGYRRSDDRITEEVHDRLTDDPWLDASGIQVTVEAGEVTLSGNVRARHDKHRAERVVENISGVAHVQNNLRVDRGVGDERSASFGEPGPRPPGKGLGDA